MDKVTVTVKPFWQSWTLWANALAVVAVVLDYVLKLNVVKDPDVVALLLAVLNLALRFKTTAPVKLTS